MVEIAEKLKKEMRRIDLTLRATQLFVFYAVLVVTLVGCGGSKSDPLPPPTQVPTRVLIVDSPELAKSIERIWFSISEDEITITQQTREEVRSRKSLETDVVIFPSSMFGELAGSDRLRNLDRFQSPDDYELDDILLSQRDHEVSWGEQRLSVSFGSPQLVLIYNQSVFEKHGVSPPATWAEYAELVSKLSQAGENVPTLEPMKGSWLGKLLLIRTAASVHRNGSRSFWFASESMEPLIDRKPFEASLDRMVQVAKVSPKSMELDPKGVFASVASGEAAMALTWPNRKGADEEGAKQLRFAPLPGTLRVYDADSNTWSELEEIQRIPVLGIAGRFGAVSSDAQRPQQAADLLFALTDAANGSKTSSTCEHTTLYRQSQAALPQLWVPPGTPISAAREYTGIVRDTNMSNSWLDVLRVEQHDQLLATLTQSIRPTVEGTRDAKESLKEAKQAWQEIVKTVGDRKLREAYLKALGNEL